MAGNGGFAASSSNDINDLPPSYSENDTSEAIEMDENESKNEFSDFDEYFEEDGKQKPEQLKKGKGKRPEKKVRICPICNGTHRKLKCPPKNDVPIMCPKCEKLHAGKCPVVVYQSTHTVINVEEQTPHRTKKNKFNCFQVVALMTFVPIVLGLVIFGFYEVFSKPLAFTPASQVADVAIIAQFSKVAFISQFSYFSIVSQVSICSVFSMVSVCSFASLFSLFSFYGLFTCTAVYTGYFSFWVIKKE